MDSERAGARFELDRARPRESYLARPYLRVSVATPVRALCGETVSVRSCVSGRAGKGCSDLQGDLMKRLAVRRPSPAMVVALLALFVAMGGTGYAALKLPKDSVGAKQIAKDAVGSPEIKNGAVGTSEVKNGSLVQRDFKQGQLPQGAQGPQGPKGDPGQQGVQGIAGTARGYGSVAFGCAAPSTCTVTAAKNATVYHPLTGIYCIAVPGADPTNTGVVATLEDDLAGDRIAYLGSSSSCPSASAFEVHILNSAGTANDDNAFFFVVP